MYVLLAHFVGGVMLILGIFTRAAAMANLPIMMGAVLLFHFDQGFFLRGVIVDAARGKADVAGYEYALFVLAATLAQGFLGTGALGLTKERHRRERAGGRGTGAEHTSCISTELDASRRASSIRSRCRDVPALRSTTAAASTVTERSTKRPMRISFPGGQDQLRRSVYAICLRPPKGVRHEARREGRDRDRRGEGIAPPSWRPAPARARTSPRSTSTAARSWREIDDRYALLVDARRELARLPLVLKALLAGLDPAGARARPAAGEWSPLEILCHLRDEETEDFGARLRVITGGGRIRGDRPGALGRGAPLPRGEPA